MKKKNINLLMEIDDIESLVDIERENVCCLHSALVDAEDEPKNYGMMMAGIVIRLGNIQDRLNTLSDMVRADD